MLLPLLLAIISISPLAEAAFSESVSRKLLNLAAGAYGTTANRTSCASKSFGAGAFALEAEFSAPCGLLNGICSGYIVSSGSTLYVVFSGSTDNVQLLEQFLKVIYNKDFHGKGVVNGYVADAHEALWGPIEEILVKPAFASCNVIFTGHSLGAALSVLTAARSVIDNVLPQARITVWTFGEPRTESYGFTSWFNSHVPSADNNIRTVHRNDYIVQLPPCIKPLLPLPPTQCKQTPLNPYHRGVEYWYNNDMNLNDVFTATCSDENFSTCPFDKTAFLNPSEPINDHSGYYLYNVPIYGRGGCP